ncbi:hypothetical protein, partial [Klebsiella pneumoniae]|uniref:hypothetical protein n=1 Tax=Klebsiella pneumoniae TaxID=573 RepID=UPI001C720BB7
KAASVGVSDFFKGEAGCADFGSLLRFPGCELPRWFALFICGAAPMQVEPPQQLAYFHTVEVLLGILLATSNSRCFREMPPELAFQPG